MLHFVNLLSSITIDLNDHLVSFNVTFPVNKVPAHDSLGIIQNFLVQDGKSPDQLTQLFSLRSLTSTQFFFQTKYYKQISGPLMRLPFPLVVANIFMETFEKEAWVSSSYKSKVWLRLLTIISSIEISIESRQISCRNGTLLII